MKIYTYYESLEFIDHATQKEMIELWRHSWERQGFEAFVLGREDVEGHPYYQEFHDELHDIQEKITGVSLKAYVLSCYLRWLAYAGQPDEKFYVSDYDVINLRFKPAEPIDGLHFMSGICPCFATGRPNDYLNFCKYLIKTSRRNIEIEKEKLDKSGEPWYQDQSFLTNNRQQVIDDGVANITLLGESGGSNKMDPSATVVHVSHRMVCESTIMDLSKNINGVEMQRERISLIKKLLRLSEES
jgi:hypothetical protein